MKLYEWLVGDGVLEYSATSDARNEVCEFRVFKDENMGSVRVINKDDEVWFVAKDVCDTFGDTHHVRSVGYLDDEDKSSVDIRDAMGRIQNVLVVNESGLYALLFAMQPQKTNNFDGVQYAAPIKTTQRIEKLKAFKRWITHDVLPSIRKTGAYVSPDAKPRTTDDMANEIMNNPRVFIKMLEGYAESQERAAKLEQQIEVDKPHTELGKMIESAEGTILVGTLAKALTQSGHKIGQNDLFAMMRQDGLSG